MKSLRPVNPKLPSKGRPACPPFLLAMSTYNFGGAQDLTQDEQILHHHAAMIKKDLDAYHTYSGGQEGWRDSFINRLASFILVICFYKPFSDLSRQN